MENKDGCNIYAVALVGGILCIMTFFDIENYLGIGPNPFAYLGFSIFILPHIICGVIMIQSAIKIKFGTRTWFDQKKRLLISSWVAIGAWAGFFIFSVVIGGYYLAFNRYGFVGGFLLLVGIYYYEYLSKRDAVSSTTLAQEKDS
jgi:hypothetical protein